MDRSKEGSGKGDIEPGDQLLPSQDIPDSSVGDGGEEIKGIRLDDWQKEILEAEGSLCICSGRQVGKTTIVSIKAAEYAIANPNKFTLIVSITEDQSERMIAMILSYLHRKYRKWIKKGKDKPTKSQIKLTNGSIIRCKPIGTTGFGVLGYTVHLLIADEAAFMPEEVWNVLTPMLLTTNGNIILISTPHISEGYFYDAYTKPEMNFRTFHINSEEVAEKRAEPQRTFMLRHLAHEKATKSQAEYARWYLAEFQDALLQLFPDKLIKECQKLKRMQIRYGREFYLGVDVARLGGDETTFEIVQKINDDNFIHIENIALTNTLITDTTKRILNLNEKYDFKRIYIDTGGLGSGVFDNLMEFEATRRKVVSINNAQRSIENKGDKSRKRQIIKEDLYMNLLRLMESGKIALLDDEKIFFSLKSVLKEVDENTKQVKIFGRYTHIAEGLIRAVWCSKEKHLNLFIDYI